MIYVIDTHSLVWFLESNKRLGKRAKSVLLNLNAKLFIPTIILAESKFLFAKKRIGIDLDTIYRQVISARNCTVYPLDEAVIDKMPTALEIHDAIIVATALVIQESLGEKVTVITQDKDIMNAGIIETLW